ncbi:MAG: DUF6338 family protein [Anaerolineae bacterium]
MSIDLQGLVVLLLFIAPGFLYSRAYLAARPRYQRAPDLFQQTVLAVVGSTLIHAGLIGSLALGVLVYTAWTRRAPLVREIFYIPTTAAEAPVSVVATYSLFAAMYITASLILARRAGAWLGHLLPERAPRWYRFLAGGDPPERVLLWYSTLVEEPLRRGIMTPHVVAWLRSGERFEGDLVELRLSADEANVIELALEDVIFQASEPARSKPSASRASKPTPLPHHRVLLRSGDILWLSRVDITEKGEAV